MAMSLLLDVSVKAQEGGKQYTRAEALLMLTYG